MVEPVEAAVPVSDKPMENHELRSRNIANEHSLWMPIYASQLTNASEAAG